MRRFFAWMLVLALALSLAACGEKWTCDDCGKEFSGTAYYGYQTTETFCEDCARAYWMPLPYQNYKK